MYWGAYKGCIDRTSTYKARSVHNTTANFRGGSNSPTYDYLLETNPFFSHLGKASTGFTRPQWRTYCINNGAQPTNYEYYKWVVYWAFVIEYANFNSQEAVNSELTDEGYHQGGLGYGLSDSNSVSSTGTYATIPCGYTNSLGNHSGEVKIVTDSCDLKYGVDSSIYKWYSYNGCV